MKLGQLRPVREGSPGNTKEFVGGYLAREEIQHNKHTHDVKLVFAGDGLLEATSIQPPCHICEMENRAFETLVEAIGRHALEARIGKLGSFRAYESRYPFDLREMVLSTEAIIEADESDASIPVARDRTVLEVIIDHENVEELLKELPEEQKDVIRKTVQGYRPREIAKMRGEATSAKVRQDKYAAMRTLGAPLKDKMRRVRRKTNALG